MPESVLEVVTTRIDSLATARPRAAAVGVGARRHILG